MSVRINDIAPDFTADSTAGTIRFHDWLDGHYAIIFSHPRDFTPVCTSEFVALSKASDRFEALDCALLALSVDSLYSHLGWIRAIRDGFGVTVSFPIVEDTSLIVGRAYGMISDRSPDAATMRSTYFIDPNGIIRAMTCYPATVGRSVDEMLRVLAALQMVDANQVVTPEGWHPGDPVLLPPHQDQASLLAEADDPMWFHRSKPQPKLQSKKG